jgi:hypothetical protein
MAGRQEGRAVKLFAGKALSRRQGPFFILTSSMYVVSFIKISLALLAAWRAKTVR